MRLLRALGHYLRQIGQAYDDAFVVQTLLKYSELSAKLLHYFQARFHPEEYDADKQDKLAKDCTKKFWMWRVMTKSLIEVHACTDASDSAY